MYWLGNSSKHKQDFKAYKKELGTIYRQTLIFKTQVHVTMNRQSPGCCGSLGSGKTSVLSCRTDNMLYILELNLELLYIPDKTLNILRLVSNNADYYFKVNCDMFNCMSSLWNCRILTYLYKWVQIQVGLVGVCDEQRSETLNYLQIYKHCHMLQSTLQAESLQLNMNCLSAPFFSADTSLMETDGGNKVYQDDMFCFPSLKSIRHV